MPVEHDKVEQFDDSVVIKYRSAAVDRLGQCEALPPKLTHLTFGRWFNQPLDNVTLPPTLTHLTFGYRFNQPLDNVTLPPTLTHLTLHASYDRQLDCLPPRVVVTRKK